MSDVITYQRFWQRRDTAANWTSVNPVLASGEFGYETDTERLKIGDGSTAWSGLDYFPMNALQTPYDNSSSGLAATNVKDAIDELASGSGGSAGILDPRVRTEFFDDFMGNAPTTSTGEPGASYSWSVINIGSGGSISSINGSSTAPGVWRFNVGTSSSGITSMTMGSINNFTPGGGDFSIKFRLRVPTLSTSSERFSVSVGIRNNYLGASTEALAIVYSDNINSGKFTLRGVFGGVTTDANGSTALVANTFYACEIRYSTDSSGTIAEMFINGSLEATLSSGLPTGVTAQGVLMAKSVGTTARTADLDYYQFTQTFNSNR